MSRTLFVDDVAQVLDELKAATGAHWKNPARVLMRAYLHARPDPDSLLDGATMLWSYTAEIHFEDGVCMVVSADSSSSERRITTSAARS